MKKVGILFISLIAFSLAVSVLVIAKPDTTRVPATNTKSNTQVLIPEHAIEISPGIFSLGTALDPSTGKIVEGLAFINYKKQNARPGTVCGNNICEPGEKKSCPQDCGNEGNGDQTSTCFATFAKGARWKTTEQYVLDPTNSDGLTNQFVEDTIATSLETWDSETSFDIFGLRDTSSTVDPANIGNLNGKNEILFADISSPGAIAVTTVWGIFSGNPRNRELVEFDQVYDDLDFNFGDALINPNVMDLQNIAAHEDGHALGLTHPADECTEETMYRFASLNETKKRTLELGDLTGLAELYA